MIESLLMGGIYSGIFLGSIYALMAVGLTLIFGVIRILNYSHGVLFVWGAYIAWWLLSPSGLGLNPFLSLSLALIIMFIIGCGLEVGVIRPLLRKPKSDITTIIATLGLWIALERICIVVFGTHYRMIPPIAVGKIDLGIMTLTYQGLVVIIMVVLSLSVLWFVLKKTRIGMAIRAVAQHTETAHLVGINISKVYLYVFAISATLAGLAGMLLSSIIVLSPTGGFQPLMMGLLIIILGGMGSLKGAACAAYCIGFIEALTATFLGTTWILPVLFGLMFIILIFRPKGLFGE